MSKNSSSSGGVGFVGLLIIVFVVLKLVRFQGNPVSYWSWWWVLAPIWITVLLVIASFTLFGLGFVIYYMIKKLKGKK